MVPGAFQSGTLACWPGAEYTGHGLATAPYANWPGWPSGELGPHRAEAGTLRHNLRVTAGAGA